MAKVPLNPVKITQDYVRHLNRLKKIKIQKAILFGSAARGDMHEDSDLDIIILSSDFKKMTYMKRLQLLSLARGDKFCFVPMDILGYTPEEFAKLSSPDESVVLSEAKRQGKVVYSK